VTVNEVIDRTLNLGLKWDDLSKAIIERVGVLKKIKESADDTRAERIRAARERAGQEYLNDPELQQKNREVIETLNAIIDQREELDVYMKHIQDAAQKAAEMATTTEEYTKYMKEALMHEGNAHPIRELYLKLIETQREIWENKRQLTQETQTAAQQNTGQFQTIEQQVEPQYGAVDLSLTDFAGAFHAIYLGVAAIAAVALGGIGYKIGKGIRGTVPATVAAKREILKDEGRELKRLQREEEKARRKKEKLEKRLERLEGTRGEQP